MVDYTLFNNEEGQPQGGLLRKSRAMIQSPGGVLSNTVQPGQGGMLPNAIDAYRAKAADLYRQGSEIYNQEPDFSQFQTFAKERAKQGEGAMLNALAAQFAGESFAPVQEQMLKKAAASRDPMKLGSGLITAEGEYLKDPEAAQGKKAEFLLQQAKAYEQIAATAQTAQEKARAEAAQNAIMNEIRAMNAQTARMAVNGGAGGGLGVGTAQQIGSGPNNEPVFRQKNGQLFTYDSNAQAVPYQGQVGPKAGSAQPSEDERKSAGYALRIEQGMNLINQITNSDPTASKQGAVAYGASKIPLVGNMASNIITPEARQRVDSAQLDVLDAALTLATGAAYTKEQLQGLSKSYFPQIGDDPKTIQDKKTRLNDILQTAKIRGGRALQQPGGGAPGANNDPLGLRR